MTNWPAPHDPAAADRLIERFQALGPITAQDQDLLRCLGGNSPFLSDLAIREGATLRQILTAGPDAVFDRCMATLRHMPPTAAQPDIAVALRQAKRQVALITAIADIGGTWTLERVTAALSDLAETALRLAVSHLLRAAHDKGLIRLPDTRHPAERSGFVVLGMGKLGASELNYSSDIDLILLYDAHSPAFTSGKAAEAIGSFTARLARDLVALIETRDANGYVFRCDLRLRPDPAATPPAVALLGALTYYESMGQNWERAAMIKARPVAGDVAMGHRFLEAIRPFVWRRGLDFAAVADIRAMKHRIDAVKNAPLTQETDPVARIAGRNVKLGQGGIREIEFLVQTLQMVWGGRDPALRIRPTLQAARRLRDAGHLSAEACVQLTESYHFLRQVEHRIQMVNDRQTHLIPEQPAEIARLACFLGFRDAGDFAVSFLKHADTVQRHYRLVFDQVPESPAAEPACADLDFRGTDPEPAATLAALTALGFEDPRRVVTAVRGWLVGHSRALRSGRARDLLMVMLPRILAALGRQPHPDQAFNRFDRLIGALPTGVQPMSLFHHNPALIDRIAEVLGAAPLLAEHLARYPSALEGLLAGESAADDNRMLRAHLAEATRLEDVIQIVRRHVKARDFLLSVATLEGQFDATIAGRHRSALAQTALRVLVPRVLDDFASRYGHVPGGGLAVVALGKAGGREMMAGSDLDLMFVYDHPPEVIESQGVRPLPASQWFVRAVQACIAALTAPGVEGQMYALDMRLRPSGNKGPIAVSLAAFERYHAEDAWTWERMALTRARVVAGPPALRARVKVAIADALRRPRDPADIRAGAAAMRARMGRELRPHGPWDVKLRVGGLIDVEFIAQVLQLVHMTNSGFVGSQTTGTALRRLRDAGFLDPTSAGFLIQAEHLWRTILGMLRLTVGQTEAADIGSAGPLLRAAAASGVAAVDTTELLHKSDDIARQVRFLFQHFVGKTD